MSTRFLFYIGTARENDRYIDLPRTPPVDHAYAGISMKLARGWVPDLEKIRKSGQARFNFSCPAVSFLPSRPFFRPHP
jgi:hypothetical protein